MPSSKVWSSAGDGLSVLRWSVQQLSFIYLRVLLLLTSTCLLLLSLITAYLEIIKETDVNRRLSPSPQLVYSWRCLNIGWLTSIHSPGRRVGLLWKLLEGDRERFTEWVSVRGDLCWLIFVHWILFVGSRGGRRKRFLKVTQSVNFRLAETSLVLYSWLIQKRFCYITLFKFI